MQRVRPKADAAAVAEYSARVAAAAPRLKAAPLYAPAQKAGLDNPSWESASARFLVVRLSPFRDAARSTGHLFLHKLIRETLGPSAFVDFAFFPSKADRAALDAADIPWLTGIDAKREAEDYDAILVSCSYALELVNLPLVLSRSQIPLKSSERRDRVPADGGRPLPVLVLGGSNALASQALIFPDGDSFVDGIFFGEGEEGGAELISVLAETKGRSIDERMDRLEARCGSVWTSCRGAPDAPQDGALRRVRPGRCSIARKPLLLDSYPLLNSEEASTARLQISWGCPSFCSFCFEGWERKPYRELPKALVLEAARKLKRESGASTVDLYSFNFNAHEDALDLIFELNGIFDRVNMMSQRADLLIRTPGMIACELAAEKRSFTVGVEGISTAMRAYYSKDLTSSDLYALMERLAKEKVRELKLFYILSGNESEADLGEFRSFCGQLRALADSWHSGLRALFSFGYLVRMPFTPLRAEALVLDRSVFQEIEESAKAAVEDFGFEFRLASDWEEYVADQLLVSGPYALAEGLLASASSGCAFDLRIEGPLNAHLTAALRKAGALEPVRNGPPLAGPLLEEKDADHRYPLSFVETEVSAAFRNAAYERAKEKTNTCSCLGDNTGACLGCSACEDEDERAFLVKHRVKPAPGTALAERISARIREKRRLAPLFFSAVLPDCLAGAEDEFLAAWLLREILRADAELASFVYRAEEALRTSPEWKERLPPGFTGEAIVSVRCAPGTDAERLERAVSAALGCGAKYREGFAADAVEGMDAEIRVGTEAQAVAQAKRWLSALKLAATERKTADGRLFEISPKDKKKRALVSVRTEGPMIIASSGIKVDFGPLFPKAEDKAAARVRLSALRGRF